MLLAICEKKLAFLHQLATILGPGLYIISQADVTSVTAPSA